MMDNIFKDYQRKKDRLRLYAQEAHKIGWIPNETLSQILTKLDNDVLTLGIVGQIKAGKSTFLNALLFGEEILPVADAPMTATLTVITYGEKKSISVEFYSADEWKEIEMCATGTTGDEHDAESVERISGAKQLVAAARLIPDFPILLGQTKEDSFENLIQYVGAKGEYRPITKMVRIQYPIEWLKGIEIVDTPGLNDPVSSREARTQDFLKKADAVILLLAANRAFDATDSEILFDKIKNVGIGKVIIGVNKYDLTFSEGESVERKTNSVKTAIRNECLKYDNNYISDMVKDLTPHLLSARMALLSQMELDAIHLDKSRKFDWDRYCAIFNISSQKEMYEKSRVKPFSDSIIEVIEQSKNDILFEKIIQLITQSGDNRKEAIEKDIAEKNILLKSISVPDYELEDLLNGLNKSKRRIVSLIKRITDELNKELGDLIEDARRKVGKKNSDAKDDCERLIYSEKKHTIARKCEDRIEILLRDLDYLQVDTEKDLKNAVNDFTNKFVREAEDYLTTYLKDYEDILEDLKYAISHNIKGNEGDDETEMVTLIKLDTKNRWLYFIPGVNLVKYSIYLYKIVSYRDELYTQVKEILSQNKSSDMTPSLKEKQEEYLKVFNTKSVEAILNSLENELEAAKSNDSAKQEKILNLNASISDLNTKLEIINNQISEMQSIWSTL